MDLPREKMTTIQFYEDMDPFRPEDTLGISATIGDIFIEPPYEYPKIVYRWRRGNRIAWLRSDPRIESEFHHKVDERRAREVDEWFVKQLLEEREERNFINYFWGDSIIFIGLDRAKEIWAKQDENRRIYKEAHQPISQQGITPSGNS